MINSLYVHIPFCNSICGYCDFCRVKYNESLAEKYMHALYAEMAEKCKNMQFDTIYIGGGTPTSLSNELLDDLLSHCNFHAKDCKEFTIEANPESLTKDKIEILKKHHISRVSLGVQAIQPKLLSMMNRKHTVKQIKECIEELNQVGIKHISIDLIYSLPTQTIDEWKESLLEVLSWKIDHISLYSLTIEENSDFARKGFTPLDEEVEADMYEIACHILEENGYHHYEISNFAKENGESLHNKTYWHYDDFIGLGMGASGKIEDKRYDNTMNFLEYFDHKWCKEEIHLEKEDIMFEMIMMGFRLKEGISKQLFYQRFHEDIKDIYKSALDANIDKGLLFETEERIIPTERGFACLNEVLLEFLKE